MNDRLDSLHTQLDAWYDTAVADGWLAPGDAASLQATLSQTPDDLFEGPQRPLVVGLFGGTGVGKSSLLNRIADEAVAEASAARPTSTRVTLYAHAETRLASLPDTLPIDRLETRRHGNARWRGVLWVDMPDVDSAETGHRDLVLRWLPHLDLLLYVMSPDRYRDDRGWRLLHEHGYLHAWIFVLNQWDRGDPLQRDDLAARLQAEGFAEPVIYCTDSRPDIADAERADDQFALLAERVEALAREQLLQQLDAHGVLQRLQETHRQAQHWLDAIGSEAQMAALPEQWQDTHQHQAEAWRQAWDWKLILLARPWEDASPGWLRRTLSLLRGSSEPERTSQEPLDGLRTALADTLLDDRFRLELATQRTRFLQDRIHEGVPAEACRPMLHDALEAIDASAADTLVDAVKRSLAQPGTPTQRRVSRLLGVLTTLLPLSVFAWVGYRLVVMFQAGGSEPARYLGSNFALHSLMLLLLAWAVPAFLHARIAPRPQQAALRGLRTGLAHYLSEREAAGANALHDAVAAHRTLRQRLTAILEANDAATPEAALSHELAPLFSRD